MKVTHTQAAVRSLAQSLINVKKHGSSTPAAVMRILVDLSRKTLVALATEMKIPGSTKTRRELIDMILAKYAKAYCAAVFNL